MDYAVPKRGSAFTCSILIGWVPEPKNNKKKRNEELLPISFHLNFEALVPRVQIDKID